METIILPDNRPGKDQWVTSKTDTRQSFFDIIDALPMAIAVINENRQVILANRVTCQFVNKNEDELIGRVGGEALGCAHHDDVAEGCGFGPECLKCTLRQTVADTMHHKKAYRMVETSMVFKNRREMHIRISTKPMQLGHEDVVLLAIEDITQAKNHERMRLEKEKLAGVVQTAGAISHEINQPLMILAGLTDLMMMDLKDGNITKKQLLDLKKQIDRLDGITDKMIQITRVQTKSYLDGEILDIDASAN